MDIIVNKLQLLLNFRKINMSQISTKFNKKDLFEELQSALDEDKKYWLQNDAKLKAVVSAKTYDEFRETVAAAHLMPVTRQDMAKKVSTWNTAARNTSNKE